MASQKPLTIVHCLRAPLGGAFRHVRDLARSQESLGHRVGILCDAADYGSLNETHLSALDEELSLGVRRTKIPREIGPADLTALLRSKALLSPCHLDIVHGHTAKGGLIARGLVAMARLQGNRALKAVYTPHGGSLHFEPTSVKGRFIFAVERSLERLTAGLVFVSRFEQESYANKVGVPGCANEVIYNGLWPQEFSPIAVRGKAADFLFIGELRALKGPDLFLKALASLRANGAPVRAVMVGDGPDRSEVEALRDRLDLGSHVEICPPQAMTEALQTARHVVMPSRAESLPYVVIETIARARPLITTNVGGIPEVFGALSDALVAADDVDGLVVAMASVLADGKAAHERAEWLQMQVRRRFSVAVMASQIDAFYRRLSARERVSAALPFHQPVAEHLEDQSQEFIARPSSLDRAKSASVAGRF